jgi:hypothetical protein
LHPAAGYRQSRTAKVDRRLPWHFAALLQDYRKRRPICRLAKSKRF